MSVFLDVFGHPGSGSEVSFVQKIGNKVKLELSCLAVRNYSHIPSPRVRHHTRHLHPFS
jgi:hypothetical protein